MSLRKSKTNKLKEMAIGKITRYKNIKKFGIATGVDTN